MHLQSQILEPISQDVEIDLFIPLAKSCGGFNAFDPSVSQSVCQSCFFVSATPLKPLNRIL